MNITVDSLNTEKKKQYKKELNLEILNCKLFIQHHKGDHFHVKFMKWQK